MPKNNQRNKIEYRDSHVSVEKALNYENNVYGMSSYDTLIWEIEKEILFNEIKLLKKGKHNIRYLDFACGTGRILSFLESYVEVAVGVDISDKMLSLAKNKIKKASLYCCDLTMQDMLEDKELDLITAFRFFLNSQNSLRREVVAVLSEKLSEKGVLIFNIHGNPVSYYFLALILNRLKPGYGSKLNFLSLVGVTKMLGNSSLKIVRFYGTGFIPSSFYKQWNVKFLFSVEWLLTKCSFLKYFARNQIFVCSKMK